MYLTDRAKFPDAPTLDTAANNSAAPSRSARWAAAGLSAAWRSGVLPKPDLDPAALIQRAMQQERQEDFGADDWRTPLSVLTEALEGQAALNPIGRALAHGQLVKILRERLRAHALWRSHPEILDRPITAPIIVLGSMRSGTTRIQRLLACDDRLTHTRLFESLSPVAARGRIDLRAARTAAGLGVLHAFNPALAAIHPTGAHLPDEEFGLFGFSFTGAQFEAQWRVPRYARWLEQGDTQPAYRTFYRLLQTIAWTRGGATDGPWVLKAPQFMEGLDALLATFPDARLLCLERDALPVVASSASLVWEQQRIQSDAADRHWIGREWLDKTCQRLRQAAAVLRDRPDVPRLRVPFSAVDRDWRGEMQKIYAFLGLRLTPPVEARMQRYLAASTAHCGHRYELADFGLSEAEVRAAIPEHA
jgi:hypothetical protein